MSLKVKCARCRSEIYNPGGGLLFSPPTRTGTCKKQHLCKGCHELVVGFIKGKTNNRTPDKVVDEYIDSLTINPSVMIEIVKGNIGPDTCTLGIHLKHINDNDFEYRLFSVWHHGDFPAQIIGFRIKGVLKEYGQIFSFEDDLREMMEKIFKTEDAKKAIESVASIDP